MIVTNLSKRIKITTILGISLTFVMASCSAKNMAFGQSPFSSHAGSCNSSWKMGKESTYVDGVHTATGNYGSRDSFISVTITLVDDIIKGIQITPYTTDTVSLDLHQHFSDVIPSNFVGKHIDEVKVNELAESSIAADALNEAIDQIKQQNRIGPTTRKK
ncbi:hypothetical protein [Paenibacillus sp. V4I7]|uniref:hypothetical protein n=1 Tax=Paenibacillus sp. V4I7 TaxID=3042307 RepID=UPI002782F719|nr:hypothetical protein [Paenibacillus sp. V4I7]MDQ0897517.1 hypothetical protein [Paenibacillus sp. V4I7]